MKASTREIPRQAPCGAGVDEIQTDQLYGSHRLSGRPRPRNRHPAGRILTLD